MGTLSTGRLIGHSRLYGVILGILDAIRGVLATWKRPEGHIERQNGFPFPAGFPFGLRFPAQVGLSDEAGHGSRSLRFDFRYPFLGGFSRGELTGEHSVGDWTGAYFPQDELP